MIQLKQKMASQISREISERIAKRRKELHFTQTELAARAGISFASYKRFEQKHEISFVSLIKIAIALNLENEFDSLFQKKQFLSIEELIADEKNKIDSPPRSSRRMTGRVSFPCHDTGIYFIGISSQQ